MGVGALRHTGRHAHQEGKRKGRYKEEGRGIGVDQGSKKLYQRRWYVTLSIKKQTNPEFDMDWMVLDAAVITGVLPIAFVCLSEIANLCVRA